MTRPSLPSRWRAAQVAVWPLAAALATAGCRDGIVPPENVTPATPLRGLGGTTTEKWQVAEIESTLCDQTWANSINDSDVVVGACEAWAGPLTPFRWQNGAMTLMPAIPGGSSAAAWAVNAGGNAVGEVSVGTRSRAFIWTAQGGVALLPLLDNDDTRSEKAFAINQSNVVVGEACCPTVAVVWTYANGAWSASSVGTLGGGFDKATGINDAGVIVGLGDDAGGERRAWRKPWGGAMEILQAGGKAADDAEASDVNNAGTIVGYWTYYGSNDFARWQPSTGMTHLGIEGGNLTPRHPLGISVSERERLVMTLRAELPFTMRGKGVALLPLPAGFETGWAADVNTCGTAVGAAYFPRQALLWRRLESGRPTCDR